MNLNPVRVIHSDDELAMALAEYETYFDANPEPGTVAADRFELLGLVIAAYEDQRWPVASAEPLEVIRMVMEARGYTQSDLASVLGSRSRASEILSGRRSLSLDHVRSLAQHWGLPIASLIGQAKAA